MEWLILTAAIYFSYDVTFSDTVVLVSTHTWISPQSPDSLAVLRSNVLRIQEILSWKVQIQSELSELQGHSSAAGTTGRRTRVCYLGRFLAFKPTWIKQQFSVNELT